MYGDFIMNITNDHDYDTINQEFENPRLELKNKNDRKHVMIMINVKRKKIDKFFYRNDVVVVVDYITKAFSFS